LTKVGNRPVAAKKGRQVERKKKALLRKSTNGSDKRRMGPKIRVNRDPKINDIQNFRICQLQEPGPFQGGGIKEEEGNANQ